MEDKKSEQQMTFDESKDKLKKDLESRRSKELSEKWMADLRAKAKIETVGRVCILIAQSQKNVIPAKAGIQLFQNLLDAGSSPA